MQLTINLTSEMCVNTFALGFEIFEDKQGYQGRKRTVSGSCFGVSSAIVNPYEECLLELTDDAFVIIFKSIRQFNVSHMHCCTSLKGFIFDDHLSQKGYLNREENTC